LLNNTLEKQDNLTLWDTYNALTNYSEHNQRAVPIGKRKSKEFDVRNSSMDKIRSNDKRTAEVQEFIQKNKTFLFFVHQGVSNQLRSN
jgi:membrane-bound lytic murein transglycosylase